MRNTNSHLTAKERDKSSFPLNKLLRQNLIKGRVLDYGSGHGKDVEHLNSLGYEVVGYDPYFNPQRPKGKFDTIICIYVLNVLETEQQSDVIMRVSCLLNPEGVAYFAVRRDLRREGFRKHVKHDAYTYQCNVVLKMESVFQNEFTEIYAFRKFSLVQRKLKSDCVFCALDKETIAENNNSYAIFDKYPVSKGHVLVISKRHVADYFELNFTEQLSLWKLTNFIQQILKSQFNPDAFNIGINAGEVAGQTVLHMHIHIIPRYKGDVENPIGGVRGVIPWKKEY